jgi:trans-aconitate methyltransferase
MDNINKFFRATLTKHSEGPRAVGWGSIESQISRFKIICDIGAIKGASILDVGCGLGRFYQYLHEKNMLDGDYVGIDINENMIKEAKIVYPGVKFKSINLLNEKLNQKYDYVVESGAFNILVENWEELTFSMLKEMFKYAKIGMAANFLSVHSGSSKSSVSHYCVPEEILKFAFDNLSKKIVLRHDYRSNDFTIFVYK